MAITQSFFSIRAVLGLELRRLCVEPFWPIILVSGLASIPLALSPYVPTFLPAMMCGLILVERNVMDMFGTQGRDFVRFVILPLDIRDVVVAKGIATMVKAVIGALVVGALHAWFLGPLLGTVQIGWAALGFAATLPFVLQVGASASVQSIRLPRTRTLDPVVRSLSTLLASSLCAVPAMIIAAFSSSQIPLLFFAVGALVIWLTIGTRATARSLDRWSHSTLYNA